MPGRYDFTAAEQAEIAERVRNRRLAQGLPPTIEDPAALARLADITAAGRERRLAAELTGTVA